MLCDKSNLLRFDIESELGSGNKLIFRKDKDKDKEHKDKTYPTSRGLETEHILL